MPILSDVVLPDYSESQEPITWSQCDQLRAKGFHASAIISLKLTRGEAMRLLRHIAGLDNQPTQACVFCNKQVPPCWGRLLAGLFLCFHCVIVTGGK